MSETYNIGFALIIFSIFLLLIGIILIINYYTHDNTTATITKQDVLEPLALDSIISPEIFIINLDRKPERYIYVSNQLDKFGLTGYQRWEAIDGFVTDTDKLISYGVTPNLSVRGGLGGCAASHMNLWRHIVDHKIKWTLILEDDAHFHPEFRELFSHYCSQIPNDAKIVYLGHCGFDDNEIGMNAVVQHDAMCAHAYLISEEGAQELLSNMLPVEEPIDIEITRYFRSHSGSYIFNGNTFINGIRPHDYKESNMQRCNFNGIVYQNREELGSTIHQIETVY